MSVNEFPDWITKSAFSRTIGVSPAAIGEAIKRGDVVVDANGFVNPKSPENERYAKECARRKRETEKGKQETARKQKKALKLVKAKADRRAEARAKITKSPYGEDSPSYDVPPKRAKKPPNNQENRKPPNFKAPSKPDVLASVSAQLDDLDAADQFKADYQIAKLREQTKALQIRNAAAMKMLIDRKFVDQVIGRIASVISNHLLTMGDRLAAECTAECGTLSPESKIAVKQIIDKDVTRSIKALKAEINEQYEKRVNDGV